MKDDHHSFAAKVPYKTAMIILHLILHSTVHLYDFHIFVTSMLNTSMLNSDPLLLRDFPRITNQIFLSFNKVKKSQLVGSGTNQLAVFR